MYNLQFEAVFLFLPHKNYCLTTKHNWIVDLSVTQYRNDSNGLKFMDMKTYEIELCG